MQTTCQGILGADNGRTRMLQVIAQSNGEWVNRELIAEQAGFSLSGTFQNYYGELRKYGLIEIKKGQFRLSDNVIV